MVFSFQLLTVSVWPIVRPVPLPLSLDLAPLAAHFVTLATLVSRPLFPPLAPLAPPFPLAAKAALMSAKEGPPLPDCMSLVRSAAHSPSEVLSARIMHFVKVTFSRTLALYGRSTLSYSCGQGERPEPELLLLEVHFLW